MCKTKTEQPLKKLDKEKGPFYFAGRKYETFEEFQRAEMDFYGKDSNPVNHPNHYNDHPSGVECLDIVRHMNFNLGNVIKYVWRADLKEDAVQDLEKALFYLKDEIEKRKNDQVRSY